MSAGGVASARPNPQLFSGSVGVRVFVPGGVRFRTPPGTNQTQRLVQCALTQSAQEEKSVASLWYCSIVGGSG